MALTVVHRVPRVNDARGGDEHGLIADQIRFDYCSARLRLNSDRYSVFSRRLVRVWLTLFSLYSFLSFPFPSGVSTGAAGPDVTPLQRVHS